MEQFSIYFLVSMLAISLVLVFSVKFASRFARALIVAVFVASTAFAYTAGLNNLSKPRPAVGDYLDGNLLSGSTILSYYLIKDKAIYMFLRVPGVSEPRYYEFPWSKKMASALDKEFRLKGRKSARLEEADSRYPDQTWQVHPAPVKKLPLKRY